MQFIHQFGNEEQKRYFLPSLASFEKIGAFALSEPEAGSDAGAIQTRITESNGQYLLNGRKTFITNAPQAEIFVVLATHDRSLGPSGGCHLDRRPRRRAVCGGRPAVCDGLVGLPP